MNRERWEQIDRILDAALECEPAERPSFLDHACAGDQALRRKVEALLAAYQQAEEFIETPALEIAVQTLVTSQGESPVGKKIGHYEILSLLGAGGMGEVYLVQDTQLRRKAALKLLPVEYARDPERARRFKQEALAASALNHPNIITIHEIGELAGAPFIVTEFVDGQTLRQRLAGEPVSLLEVLDIAVQIAGALAAAHAARIVHRDIKPENIMLRPDGLVKILDFGLAKLTEPHPLTTGAADLEITNTNPGVIMGTITYMSPEQVRGQVVDARTDLFSLGVVIYEMLAGQAPFARTTRADTIAAILEKEPAPLQRFMTEMPEAIERIARRALCKDREERYQTAQEMFADLKQFKQRLELEAELGRAGQSLLSRSGGEMASTEPRLVEPVEEPHPRAEEVAGTARQSSKEYLANHKTRYKRGRMVVLASAIVLAVLVSVIPWNRQSQPAITEAAPRPIHWWTFDYGPDDSGTSVNPITTIYDFSHPKGRIPGLKAGNCTLVGDAVSLTGEEGSFVHLGTGVGQFGKADFTVAFWFNTTVAEQNSEVLSNRLAPGSGNFFSLRFINNQVFPGGRLSMELDQDDKVHNYLALFSPIGLSDGKWHHFAGRRQGLKSAMLIDGVVANIAETSNRIGDGVTDINNGQPLMLGSSPFLQEVPGTRERIGISRFRGAIDELQIYDRALSDREINTLFMAGQDSDGDGICNKVDGCPRSDRSQMLVIGGCQTNVANYLLPDGCTINDKLAECAATASSRAKFTGCVARLTSDLLKAGTITAQEKENIERCAALTNIP